LQIAATHYFFINLRILAEMQASAATLKPYTTGMTMTITEMLNVGCYDSMLGKQESYERIFGGDDVAPIPW
jgi:hypothetical protein